VRSLKVQQQQVEALTANSTHFDLDITALSQAKEVIATVRKRLDVAQRMLENDMVFQGEDPNTIASDERNVVKEIHDLFVANAAPEWSWSRDRSSSAEPTGSATTDRAWP